MAKEIKLPQLDKSMEEAIIIKCLVKIGQFVKKGDFLFEIESDKATFEMESPEEGFVKAIAIQEGQTVAVGQVLLILGDENEKVDVKKTDNEKTGNSSSSKNTSAEKKAGSNNTQSQTNYKLGRKVPLSEAAKINAEKMLQSKREKPCFYLNVNVDVTELCEKLSKQTDLSLDDFLMKAVALGLAQWPVMAGRLEGDNIILADSIDIGLYTIVNGKVFAVVLKDADKKSLAQIAQDRIALIKQGQAENNLEDGCITISNLGPLGVDSFIPIVIPGQCCILGVGKITDTCVTENDKPVVHKFMKMTLAVDHKIANGAEAAQFLNNMAKLLEDPEKLI